MTKLDEYFDRARRAEPPLQKDEVSSILAEKLKQRSDDDDAHRRYKSVFSHGVGRIFSLLSPKGWIMLSMLTSAVVAFILLLPNISRNTRIEETPKTQSTSAMTTNRPNNNKITNNQANKPEVARSQANKPQIASNQTTKPQVTNNQVIADRLPAPYDFVPVDEPPSIDIGTLNKSVQYPEEAKKLGIEGKVNVRVLVMPDGHTNIEKTFIETSDARMLDSAALKAIFATQWTPAIYAGKRVACWVSIPITFRNPERIGAKSVSKTQILRLSDQELLKIGVTRDTLGQITASGWNSLRTGLYRIHCGQQSQHPTSMLMWFDGADSARVAKEIGKYSLPELITDGYHRKYFIGGHIIGKLPPQKTDTRQNEQLDAQKLAFQALGEAMSKKIDITKLIGIRIVSKQARSEGDEYLLWYDPTPEFIALLPERYRIGLEREVEAAKKYATKCEIPTEEERKAVPGYFDSWRSCDGTLKITSIFPNPADVQATVRFTLQEARSITITVHNLNGERLAILEPTPVLPAGEHELPLDFTGRNIGVYLLALSTDKNETAIKRVMIVR